MSLPQIYLGHWALVDCLLVKNPHNLVVERSYVLGNFIPYASLQICQQRHSCNSPSVFNPFGPIKGIG